MSQTYKQILIESYKAIHPRSIIKESTTYNIFKSWIDKTPNENIRDLLSNVETSCKVKNLSKIESLVKTIPIKSVSSIDDLLSIANKEINPEFGSNHEFTYNIIKNSLGDHPEYMMRTLAIAISSIAILSDSPKAELNKMLLKTINYISDKESEFDSERNLFFLYMKEISSFLSSIPLVSVNGSIMFKIKDKDKKHSAMLIYFECIELLPILYQKNK